MEENRCYFQTSKLLSWAVMTASAPPKVLQALRMVPLLILTSSNPEPGRSWKREEWLQHATRYKSISRPAKTWSLIPHSAFTKLKMARIDNMVLCSSLPKRPWYVPCGGLSFSKTMISSSNVAQKHLHRDIMVVRGWGAYKMCSLLSETWYSTLYFALPKSKAFANWLMTLPSALPNFVQDKLCGGLCFSKTIAYQYMSKASTHIYMSSSFESEECIKASLSLGTWSPKPHFLIPKTRTFGRYNDGFAVRSFFLPENSRKD